MSDLEIEFITKLSLTWYGTPGHCLLYLHVPSTYRVLWKNQQDNNQITAACFFRRTYHYLSGNCVQIDGSTSLTYFQLSELLKASKQKILIFPVSEELKKKFLLPWWKGQFLRTESDWIIRLPKNSEEYLSTLGKTSRKHLKNYLQKLNKSMDSEIKILTGSDINMEYFEKLINLHKISRKKDGKEITIGDDDIIRRFELAKRNGLLLCRLKDGNLISGTLNYVHLSDVYLSLVAHDRTYDEYHLGMITVYDTVNYLIDRQYRNYNLHFRYSPLKTRLGAKEHQYYNLFVFNNFLTAVNWNIKRLLINSLQKIKSFFQK